MCCAHQIRMSPLRLRARRHFSVVRYSWYGKKIRDSAKYTNTVNAK